MFEVVYIYWFMFFADFQIRPFVMGLGLKDWPICDGNRLKVQFQGPRLPVICCF